MWKSGGKVYTTILMGRKPCRRLVLFFFAILALCIIISLEFSSTEIENEKNEIIMNVKHSQLNTPKVRFVVAQTMFAPGWCRMLASAILSNISVATVGFGKKYTHTRRISWIMRYIEEEELRDYDVIISFDGADTLFTGALAVQKAIDKFINTTASSADSFNAMDVISGKATAPFLFTAEGNCYHPQLYEKVKWGVSKGRCISSYKRIENVFLEKEGGTGEKRPHRVHYLNAGGYIARVWAFKKAFEAYRNLMKMKRWWCDQSAWGLLYLWSISQNMQISSNMRIPYGIINLDFYNSFFLSLHSLYLGKDINFWSSKTIAEVIASDKLPFPLFFNIINSPNSTPAIMHFNGIGRGDPLNINNLRNYTSWFRESMRNTKVLNESKYILINKSFLKIYDLSTSVKIVKYGDVCNFDIFS